MVAAALPENERDRLERLRSYRILDTGPEEEFDRIVRLAASVLDVPIALISLVDEGRQWFKARVGLDARETPREMAFCAHAIHGMDVYVVHDATQNPLFRDNALVTGAPDIRFYAGAPLRTHDGFNLGTVCAIDRIPREPTNTQLALLHDLAALTSDLLELRTAGRIALDEVAERKRIDAFKSAFISTVNHELRTPLTSIIGAIELINTGVAGEISQEVGQLISIADRNSAVLLRLINDLLDSAKLADRNLEFELTVTDIHQVVRESVENIENYCRDHNVTVTYQGSSVARVRADRLRISQVMNNLLSNAVKFSPPKSAVTVTLAERNGFAEVSVIDMAGGIPESIRPRIFEKFVQAKQAGVSSRPGTGLGLSIAKAIVEHHGGEIGFETQAGVGTRFFFTLPVIAF